MTAAVDRLEQRGLVERRSDDRDRRTRVVHLTEQGRELIQQLFAAHEQDMERPISCLDPTEVVSLIRILRKLGRGPESMLPGHSSDASPHKEERT